MSNFVYTGLPDTNRGSLRLKSFNSSRKAVKPSIPVDGEPPWLSHGAAIAPIVVSTGLVERDACGGTGESPPHMRHLPHASGRVEA